LHYAAARGYDKLVEDLVDKHEAKCDLLVQNRLTALHAAVGHGHIKMVKFFIENKKQNPNVRCNKKSYERSPLHMATLFGQKEITRYLVEKLREKSMVIDDVKDSNGKNPLHYSTEEGRADLVKFFIEEAKLNPNICDTKVYTPLHLAAYKKQ